MLSELYFGNSLSTWIYALFIATLAVIIGRTIYWAIQKIFVKRNGTKSLFIDMLEEPLAIGFVIFGLWLATDTLTIIESVEKFVNDTFYILVLLNIAWFITRLFDSIVTIYIEPKVKDTDTDLDDILIPLLKKIIKIAVWILMLIVGLDNAGYNVTTMITGLGLGGLVFALAAKDTVSNLFGGFVIFSDKPYSLNDRIVYNGYEGFVREIGLRSTRLETFDKRIVVIPNTNVIDGTILNVSKEPGRRMRFHLGVTYNTTPEKIEEAKQILLNIINSNENCSNPTVALENFGDFSINILVIYWINQGSPIVATQDNVNMNILRQFNEKNIEFAFPTQTLYVEKS